jgi:hypothetical protein
MSDMASVVREASFCILGGSNDGPGLRHRRGRGQNFLVDWIEAQGAPGDCTLHSADEMLLLLPAAGATLEGEGERVDAPGRSICILPPGRFRIALGTAGLAIALRTGCPEAERQTSLNAGAYAPPNPRVAPVGPAWKRTGRRGIAVVEVDNMPRAAGRPRLKMLQSATMSINWVEYEGMRDRTQLSPHSHDDFEQGSLAIFGGYVHHLRTPWGPDATAWREDVHMPVPEGSLTVIPPGLIHTTEGVGEGRHLLIDIFAPVRSDFVEKGWIANAGDYAR